jgi:hypothetical protein
MKRKLILLNIALVVLAAAASWQLRTRWLEGKAQERKVLAQSAKPMVAPPPPALETPQPAKAAGYSEVAQKTLFSRDRNPNVVVEIAPPKPVPEFPVAYGIMSLGDEPSAILSAKSGERSRQYSVGDKVGEFTLAEIENDGIVLEWDGRQFRKSLKDLRPAAPPAPAAPAAAAPAGAAPTVVAPVRTPVASPDPGPGAQTSEEHRSCQAGDTAPAGTIRNGYRKVLVPSPFGDMCRWDLVK